MRNNKIPKHGGQVKLTLLLNLATSCKKKTDRSSVKLKKYLKGMHYWFCLPYQSIQLQPNFFPEPDNKGSGGDTRTRKVSSCTGSKDPGKMFPLPHSQSITIGPPFKEILSRSESMSTHYIIQCSGKTEQGTERGRKKEVLVVDVQSDSDSRTKGPSTQVNQRPPRRVVTQKRKQSCVPKAFLPQEHSPTGLQLTHEELPERSPSSRLWHTA